MNDELSAVDTMLSKTDITSDFMEYTVQFNGEMHIIQGIKLEVQGAIGMSFKDP